MFKRIPILMYHAIEPKESKRLDEADRLYNVTPENFRMQMEYLKREGFRCMSLADLHRMEDGEATPEKAALLTFDDGHISHYDNALPILSEFGFTAVFFLVVNDIGKKNHLGWEEAKALKMAGMDIGSHSMNHRLLHKSSHLDLVNELKSSQITLREELGMDILAYSIPRGMYSPKISEVARGMGYKFVFTSFTGNVSAFSDPYRLRRTVVLTSYGLKEFSAIVNKDPMFIVKKRLEQFAKTSLQRALGLKRYEVIKKALLVR